ncbi:unnamed protein product [Lactuca saligna]|uniref:Uncharacterized protein n=1 Tax=Lactuca saligna TaxID=75948 RepID=A0AA35ZX87_LACSI|nr:unnamed protein product [Lactuca saligna]
MTKSKVKMMTAGRSNEVETSTGKWLVQKRKSSKSIDESTTTTSKEKEKKGIYVKKRIGDGKYVKGVTKIKEAKRKKNSEDNRAAIKKQKTVKEKKTVKDAVKEKNRQGVAFNKH